MATLIVPVRGLRDAKSRLRLAGVPTRDLVAAMLCDTVSAALAADLGPVVVISPDEQVREIAERLGANMRLQTAGGLNEAISAVAPAGQRSVAMLADLPAVRPEQLRSVLTEHERGFVPDHTGSGTTLVVDTSLHTNFGPGSAARHAAQGLPRIELGLCGLTVDVDTAEDLRIAAGLGVGDHTSRLLEAPGAGNR